MVYHIVIDDDALKFLAGLPIRIKRQIAGKIEQLANNPKPKGYKKIRGRETTYRIRSGDYRIIYEVHKNEILVFVIRIRHRKNAYKGF